MYDIVYIGSKDSKWDKIKSTFPNAKIASTVTDAQTKIFTKMFWAIWPDIDLIEDFKFDYEVDEWSEDYIHVFLNDKIFDGVCLFPKRCEVSNRELSYRFFSNKKEINITASKPEKYNVLYVKTYEDYVNGLKKSTTDFVYVVPCDIYLKVDFNFNYKVPYWEKDIIHAFKNGDYYDGVWIQHKDKEVSKKEFDYRFFTNKKEIDIVASTPEINEVIYCSNYQEYLSKRSKIKSKFYYVVTSNLNVDNFNFNYQIPTWDKDIVHIFKNQKYYDGIFLCSKDVQVSSKEYDYKFFMRKKELDINASIPKTFDVVFISYYESNADKHFRKLQEHIQLTSPSTNLIWIRDVDGIHQAHKKAAERVKTNMFFVVDGDAEVVDDFDLSYQVASWDQDTVHVWRAKNPVNNLEYGYGGAKLLPTKACLNMNEKTTDMTTTLSPKFKAMPTVSNISVFDTDPWSTWKSAFRECAKLSSKVIDRQDQEETDERLKIWTTTANGRFREYAIRGARAGMEFGLSIGADLRLINDFAWLREKFNAEN